MQEILKKDINGTILTEDLRQAVNLIKGAIQRSQARSLQHVNNEILSLHYVIGQYISENTRQHYWGTKALQTISDQLQKDLPVDQTELLAQIRQTLGDEFNWADFLRVPFSHHVIILRKVKETPKISTRAQRNATSRC